MKSKTVWVLRQLLPLKYHSVYQEGQEKTWHYTKWNMWFGKCYDVEDRVLSQSI